MHNYTNNNIRFFSSASNDDDNDSASNNKVGYTSLSSTVHNDKNLPLAEEEEEEGLANNVKEQMINKLYNAHLEHDDEMKLNLLSYYINGMDSIEDPLLGDLETKSFFYEVAAHSLPQGNAWNNMKNLETSIKLFKKFCKYDEGKFDIEFTNSDICLLMATELFDRIQASMTWDVRNKNVIHMKLKSGHAARKIQIVNKYDEKMLTYFIDLFEFVRNNNIFNEQIFDLNISDAAIYMYGHDGNFDNAKKLLFERDDVKKYPEEIMCEFVRFFLLQSTKTKRAIKIDEVMEFIKTETNINEFDSTMFHHIFQACLKAKKYDTAMTYITKFKYQFPKKLAYDNLYSLMIRCCRAKRKHIALQLYNQYKDIANKKNNIKNNRNNPRYIMKTRSRSFAALLDCYPRNLNNSEQNFELITKLFEELKFDINKIITKVPEGTNNSDNMRERKLMLYGIEKDIMYESYFKKCLEFKKYEAIMEIYQSDLNGNGKNKINSRLYPYILRAAILYNSTRRKNFKRGLKFYYDEIKKGCVLDSKDYHMIITAFQRDFLDTNSIHMAHEVDKIFQDAIDEKQIDIFPMYGMSNEGESESSPIKRCDLHSINNRQTALVAVKYICKYFNKEMFGDGNKDTFDIVVGKGRFQENSVFMTIIKKYLDHEKIRYRVRGKNGVITLNWQSVLEWRK